MVRHFQYKVEVFFKEIILDGSLEKTKYYAICIEIHFQCIQTETTYSEFIEKIIKKLEKLREKLLSDYLKDLELLELVKTYQVHTHSRTWWKQGNIPSRMVDILLRRQLLQNHLILTTLD